MGVMDVLLRHHILIVQTQTFIFKKKNSSSCTYSKVLSVLCLRVIKEKEKRECFVLLTKLLVLTVTPNFSACNPKPFRNLLIQKLRFDCSPLSCFLHSCPKSLRCVLREAACTTGRTGLRQPLVG